LLVAMKTESLHDPARREKVARARRLLADPAYPPRPVLEKVAEKLAAKVKIYRRAKNRNN